MAEVGSVVRTLRPAGAREGGGARGPSPVGGAAGKPLRVRLGVGGIPAAVAWTGGDRPRWRPVERILDVWKETGAWWEGEGEITVFRLLLAGGILAEVDRVADGIWLLHRIYD